MEFQKVKAEQSRIANAGGSDNVRGTDSSVNPEYSDISKIKSS